MGNNVYDSSCLMQRTLFWSKAAMLFYRREDVLLLYEIVSCIKKTSVLDDLEKLILILCKSVPDLCQSLNIFCSYSLVTRIVASPWLNKAACRYCIASIYNHYILCWGRKWEPSLKFLMLKKIENIHRYSLVHSKASYSRLERKNTKDGVVQRL